MAAIVIESTDKASLKLLSEMAKKLGGQVTSLDKDQTEDLLLGLLMKKEKTGKNVDRETVMKKLRA